MSEFARRLLHWHKCHGRHDLPWQHADDPYRVWLSEIMLQQTQVGTVIPYYQRFLARFPTLRDLSEAESSEVMAQWSGLGYYARARNLHLCARMVWRELGGRFPREPEKLAALPGIGRSTANAIAVFCFSAHAPILDGNVKRVLVRIFGIEGFPGSTAVERSLWQLAEEVLPQRGLPDYIQAQMDFGATQCTRAKPRCNICPMTGICVAHRDMRVAELPTPRPKRTLSLKRVTVLVLRDGDRVLLLQRPPSGIWGGLQSLPELDPTTTAASAAAHLGCDADEFRSLPSLLHTFTHFQLEIHPLEAQVKPLSQVRESEMHWVALDDLDAAPLPTPIRRILTDVRQSASPCAAGSV